MTPLGKPVLLVVFHFGVLDFRELGGMRLYLK